jgi:single-stranded-DNA-specific exonuclease
MKNMEKALKRFVRAIEKNEKITIYADYDADGIPGAVILSNLLEKISHKNYTIYIPHRHDEGYGIHTDAIDKIIDSGTQLIISIDVGITAHESAQLCKENNIDLIITDHHLPIQKNGKDNLPEAFTILNPKQSDDTYPDKMICGAGVIFKFIQAFIQKHGEKYQIETGWEKWLLDMLGIATISDMVPLKNENRIFAYYGMKVIKAIAKNGNNHRPGLKNLLWNAGIQTEYMTEEDISFGITPRINAASRMSHPEDALAVFLSQNNTDAQASVEHLTQLNNERKKLTKKTTDSALALLKEKEIKDVIVVGDKNWKAGILGLVASKLVEKYKVPAFVWSQEGDMIKGSCRSLDELHLVDIMQDAHVDSFIGFGGHAEAGGFSCKLDEIDALEKRLQKSVQKYKKKNTERKKTQKNIDMELSVDAISLHNYQEMRKLAPFGIGNEKPLFLFKKVLIESVGTFGKDKNHLEIFFKNSLGKTIRGIAFFKTPKDFKKLKENKACDIVAHMEYSVFMGKHELRLQIVDII